MNIRAANGAPIPLPPGSFGALRLITTQVYPKLKGVTFHGDDGRDHAMAPLTEDSGYLLISKGASSDQVVYHVDVGFNLIAAVRLPIGRVIPIFGDEAKKELQDELDLYLRTFSGFNR